MPRFNVPFPTMGGRQFWEDRAFFRGWRIQQHVLSGHSRLLDPSDIRRAWGTHEDCRKALDQARIEMQLEPMTGTAVIALHGILRSSKSWDAMRHVLEPDGYHFVAIDYPSTQRTISQFADQLQSVIESLEGIEKIHFVVHSMGGLVVRRWCQSYSDPRIGRLVMIGTPNAGAEIATMLRQNLLFRTIFGPAGQELVAEPDNFTATLPVPPFEFGVIAGARGIEEGFNPLIPGDDDGIVTVNSARLAGATDSYTVRCLHSFQCWNPDAMQATRRYLQTGAFRESGEREPIM